MNRFKIISAIIVFLVVILSLPLSFSQNLKMKLTGLFSPVFSGSARIFNYALSIKNVFTAYRENKNLHTDLDNIKRQLNIYNAISEENKRLTQLLAAKQAIPYEMVCGRVISRDAALWYKTITIDKGKTSGIDIDMPVVSGNGGLVGRIINCGEDNAVVLLITDINSNIGSIVQDTRVFGIVEGDGAGGIILNLIPQKADISPGSIVVTSGMGQVFPKDIPIAVIAETKIEKQGLFKTGVLTPQADIDRIEEVLVMKKVRNKAR